MKLQHWLVDIQYVPGEDNGLADALSREERRRSETTNASLVLGDVEETPPQQQSRSGKPERKYQE